MLFKKTIFIFISIALSTWIMAQGVSRSLYKDFEQIAEVEIEYVLEHPERSFKDNSFHRIQKHKTTAISNVIKQDYLSDPNLVELAQDFFKSILIEQVLAGKLEGFTNTYFPLTPETARESITFPDTTIYVDPLFHNKSVTIKPADRREWIKSYKVKQLWLYDKKQQKLHCVPTQIIPILWHPDGRKRETFKITLPVYNDFHALDINSPETIWVAETIDQVDLLGKSKNLKGDLVKTLKTEYWEKALDKKRESYETTSRYSQQLAPDWFLRDLKYGRIDTLTSYYPETKKEEVEYVQNNPTTLEVVIGYEVRQLWSYNKKKERLECQIISLTPLIEEHDYKYRKDVISPLIKWKN